MKKICLALLTVCSLFSTQLLAYTPVPSEVSALLQEQKYQQKLNEKVKEARSSGRTLHIVSFDVQTFGSEKYVYITLSTSLSADVEGQLTPAGSIVGRIALGPLGEVGFDSIYFKPAEEGPGGSSVGNQ